MNATENEIWIRGDARRIFELGWAVEDWPAWLPHYRWVRVLADDGERRTVEMAASRTGWPVKWTSLQWRDPERLRIRFRHVGGVSRGMDVEWRIDPVGLAGAVGPEERPPDADPEARRPLVHVAIYHDLRLECPIVRSAAGRWVVGELFVKAIASRTLACLKHRVESECAGNR